MISTWLRKIFNIGHPWRCFLVGLFLCGVKFPVNWWTRDNAGRQEKMEATNFGITILDTPEMKDAWERVNKSTRMSHDLTNLTIEWVRRWNPYSTKWFSMIVLGLILLNILQLVALISTII